ncbi:MAG TPA: glycosyltransferase [Candidatus Eisenbacteria bacterium]|nr:glycosyltransferase [Candidatus Eisenbacteria bacterium]
MTDTFVSVVLPVYKQEDHIAEVVREAAAALGKMPLRHEIVLVPNGGRAADLAACAALAAEIPSVRSEPLAKGGWGRAVRYGLAKAKGDLLCYTNSARTAPPELTLTILYAATHAGTVVKANRKIRDHWTRRLGSLLYNLECRALFDLSCWDVNGTPKVFPRTCERLLQLTHDDDLIDAEFVRACREAEYPMLEVPIFSTRRFGGQSTTNLRSAVRMYWGAWAMRRASR